MMKALFRQSMVRLTIEEVENLFNVEYNYLKWEWASSFRIILKALNLRDRLARWSVGLELTETSKFAKIILMLQEELWRYV